MARHEERKKSFWQKLCPCCCGDKSQNNQDNPMRPVVKPDGPPTSPFPTPSPTPSIGGALKVESVDLLKQRGGETRRAHHTDEFEYDELIVRRGQPFKICVTFQRAFNPKSDHISVVLQMANSQPITLQQVNEFDESNWGCQVAEVSGCNAYLWLNTSAQAPVGLYQMNVKTNSGGESNSNLKVYILFNAWCRMDSVFLDNEAWRQEYVLNEIGRIYYGTENQIGERSWNYGQFDKGILDACLFLLDRGRIAPGSRGDPITVTRVVSAMVNSMDDNGVIAGSWSGNYGDGVNPVAWVGSVDILLRYHQTGNPIKYGQCWVFGGVTTTVLRCLGIAGRTITNFASAHDADGNLTFDIYFDENMKPIEEKNCDSVWNYHVWNDCWMTRPDLPAGYGGWQAIDATPQETSNGIYCCGPCPVLAIKNGQTNIKYDAPFIFAEVNSDKICYQRMPNGQFKKVLVEERAVGHCMSTKAVGSFGREDITYLYKYPEGSAEERNSVRSAAGYSNKPMASVDAEGTSDVVMTVESQDGVIRGSDINIRVILKNNSNSRRCVSLSMAVGVMYYNGVCKESFKNETKEVLVNPGEGSVQGDAIVGQQIVAEVVFKNPLNTTLHNAVFHVEGPGLQRPKVIPFGNIEPLQTVTVTEHFTPRRPGPRQFIASLESNELSQVHGVIEVVVQSS
ncbi:hypothetical protein XELAEV_18007006mg [Xenopus laevis]|uniref:Protein-glutamine gamma-glutamyltransferase K n=1 Tax=Xenopus laevis TaxID=8355 RepID=A0A974E1H0_XENLA|nr:hypothetical protein XELAEV_18007006mg [Xenopus laevis]